MSFSVLFQMIILLLAVTCQASILTPTSADHPVKPVDDASVTFSPISTSSHELKATASKQFSSSGTNFCGATFTPTFGPRCTAQITIGRITHNGRFGTTTVAFQQVRGNFVVTIRAFGSGVYINSVGAAVTMNPTAPSFGTTIFSASQGVTAVAGGFASSRVPALSATTPCCFSQIYVHMSINQCVGSSCSPRRQSFSTTVQCGTPC